MLVRVRVIVRVRICDSVLVRIILRVAVLLLVLALTLGLGLGRVSNDVCFRVIAFVVVNLAVVVCGPTCSCYRSHLRSVGSGCASPRSWPCV